MQFIILWKKASKGENYGENGSVLLTHYREEVLGYLFYPKTYVYLGCANPEILMANHTFNFSQKVLMRFEIASCTEE